MLTKCNTKSDCAACIPVVAGHDYVYLNKESSMKRLTVILSMLSILFVVSGALAVDKMAISKNVDDIVAAIDEGKDATSFTADAYDPYVFILEEAGTLLVHPSLQGESLKEKAAPVYEALVAADPSGGWIQYEWKGNMKNTYAKRTKGNLIVGSGY
jgi:signal transduction histidine kinase